MRSNTKLLLGLINRVAVRLPINSGRKIESLEHDPIVQQTVAAIIELSTFKLSTIANALGSVLENISKQSPSTKLDHHHPTATTGSSLQVLQSQLFILRLLSACMQHHWKSYCDQPGRVQQAIEGVEATTATTGTILSDPSPRQSMDAVGVADNGASAGDSVVSVQQQSICIPPLDDALVSFIVALMNWFLNQEVMDQDVTSTSTSTSTSTTTVTTLLSNSSSVSSSNSTTNNCSSNNNSSSNNAYGNNNSNSSSSNTNNSTTTTAATNNNSNGAALNGSSLSNSVNASVFVGSDHGGSNHLLAASDVTLMETMIDIHKVAGKVLYYISASNWSFYYSKIKSAVQGLGSLTDTAGDHNPPDIRMLEYSCLTRERLHTVLTELGPYYLHMKRHGKLIYSKMTRRGIWRWIETHPHEFEQVCASDNRLLGGSKILFDMCSSSADTSAKQAIMWPLQTILLSLSPDLLLQAFLDNPSQNRRTSFLGTLRKSLKTSKTADIAAFCYVDLCKAATYIQPCESSVLHHIAGDIDSDLREKIWTVSNEPVFISTSTGYSIDQQTLTTQYLLTRLRLDTEDTLATLVPSCLDDHAPIRFKQALVKACLAIAEDDNALPWNPTLEKMYDPLCSTIRKLFTQAVGLELRQIAALHQHQQTATLNRKHNTELVQDILRLYKMDPLLALMNHGQEDENGQMMVDIANLFQHTDSTIRQYAIDCLSKLHSAHTIPRWGPQEAIIPTFWSISSKVIFSLARQMLDDKKSEEEIKALLNLLKKLLKSRCEFMRKHWEWTNEGVKERLEALIALEIALLVSLCSPNPDICLDSIRCLGYLCDEAEYGNDDEDPQLTEITYICNLPIYFDLASEGSVFLGRKAQQKRIRKYLRMMTQPTPGNLAAWEEGYKRWKALMKHIRHLDNNTLDMTNSKSPVLAKEQHFLRKRLDLDEDKPTEWQNYTGFLASLGVCCLTDDTELATMDNGERFSNMTMYNVANTNASNRRLSSPSEPSRMIDRFMAETTDLLVSDNVFIRESVKDSLGNDLSTALYAILFHHLTSMTAKLFANEKPITGKTNTLFVEQAILVLKLILDRLVDPNDCLMNIEFGSFILQFTRYVDVLSDNYVTLRVKIKLCTLVETCLSKKEQIVIGNETRLRNKLLGVLRDWTSNDTQAAISASQNDTLRRDLDQACLKTMVQLLHRLPLQPLEPVRTTDALQTKSKLFYGYFDFFLRVLARCGHPESNHGAKDVSPNKEMAPLKNYTISAMTNMLNANIDAGLKFALAMGYHNDPSIRTAFIQVLTNILNQGVEFDTLAENVTTSRYDQLLDMLVESDMEIALSLCEVCPVMDTTGLAEVLLACFESRRKEMLLMKAVIEREVAETEQEATLLRGTTMGIKLISAFTKMLCLDYVRNTLKGVLETINGWTDNETTSELDPRKFRANDDVDRNKANVIRATEMLLDAICSSAEQAPRPFREELYLISEAVRRRFPEAKYTAVGGVVILRLFGPAIVSPGHSGFTKAAIPRNDGIYKLLLQATRVIQNLASNILFGSKETHMIILNDFLTDNIYRMTSFLRELSASPQDTGGGELTNIVRVDQNGYIKLHRYLSDNIERMNRDLHNRRAKGSASGSTQSLLDLKRMMDRLSNLLAQLGRPTELSDFGLMHSRTSTNGINQQISDFMKRNTHRDISSISSSNFFYLGGTSIAGHPVFYLIARNVDPDYMDFELVVCHMLTVMEPYLNTPFELVFDLTFLTEVCEIPVHWLSLFFQLIGSCLNDFLVCISLYNPNTQLRAYLRRFPWPILKTLVKRMIFSLTLPDLYKRISPSELRIPKHTAEIEKEHNTVFYPVTRQTHLKSTISVTVKISAEHIQIITVRPIDVLPNIPSVLKDVYHISVLDDFKALGEPRPDGTADLSFKYEQNKASMVLSTSKRDGMLALLRYLKQNYERNKPGGIHERPLRPSDVPGRLLSMALLNIGNEDPGIRLAAYNLLYSLSITFRFDMANQLLNTQDLCIPANSTDFLIDISERLAASEPQLTLDFLDECLVGFHKSDEAVRQLCLDYASPWLQNLAIFIRHTPDDHNKNLSKTKDLIRLMIKLTVSHPNMYKHVQAKIWTPLTKVNDLVGVVLDTFIQYAVEHGVGSPQAEALADTFVTLSSVTVRGKVISRLRKALQCTSLRPCRRLTEHGSWTEIITLLRFILMLSFNNASPVKLNLPELFHVVTLLVGNGSIMVRASVHELVVNIIHTLCTTIPLPDDQVQKLQFILNDVCDVKNRIYFGLKKNHANSLTITPDTLADQSDGMDLTSLECMIRLLIEALNYGAPSVDVANMWRARWMGLITSTAFQFNPAIQPRAFVALGCLATDEVDDDLIYQILVALRGALAIFDETDASLVISIMMCLSNIIDNLSISSRYMHSLYWLAISLVQLNHPDTFASSVRFLQSVLRAMDGHKLFIQQSMAEFLLATREPLVDVTRDMDLVNGVSFDSHFSFAVACILLKGIQKNTATEGDKSVVYECLSTFLEIDCKRCLEQQKRVEAKSLGYLVGLLPLASKNNAFRELLRLAGINDVDLDGVNLGPWTRYGGDHSSDGVYVGPHLGQIRIFDALEIPDNTTALLLVSFLVTMLNTAENEAERLFLYTFLSEASVSIPEVFALVYESLLPKMNQIAISSQNYAIIDAVKRILMTACSEPAFYHAASQKSQRAYLEELGFSALGDPSFGASKTDMVTNAQLTSKLLERITE